MIRGVFPKKNDFFLKTILEHLKSDPSSLFIVPLVKKPHCVFLKCHENVLKYVSMYGGKRILGYYFLVDESISENGIAILHSVWENSHGDIIDITPFEDNRKKNLFLPLAGNLFDYHKSILIKRTEIHLEDR